MYFYASWFHPSLTCSTEGHRTVLPPNVGVHGEAVDPLLPPPWVPAVVVVSDSCIAMAVGLRGRPHLAGQSTRCGVHDSLVVISPGGLLLTPAPWLLWVSGGGTLG